VGRELTEIAKYNKRLASLRSERSSFIPVYQELSDYVLSHRGRFLTTDRNKGYKRNTKQINNTARLASRTLAAGMMSGITSPARPWFRLGTPDPDLMEFESVKQWLHRTQMVMYRVFAQSNFYNSVHVLYSELGTFGTGVMGIYPDFKNVIRCRPYTVGSYMLGTNGMGIVDTFYHEHELTVGQIVKEFGIDNVSEHIKQQWNTGNTEAWLPLVHLIEPNDNRDRMSPLARDKAYRSVYYERGKNRAAENAFLRRSGFDDFSIIAARWDLGGDDIYATDCPGMTALGDIKALQLGERRKFQALDKVVDPPMQGPAAMRNKVNKSLRNGEYITTDGSGSVSSIYGNFRPDLAAMVSINNETESRINEAFYKDLFLMLANTDRREITAREVAEKHEEKLLMLGPVLERFHSEGLDPIIDITFNKLQRAGVLPHPPPEMNNVRLQVNYVSVLAQAQRLVALSSLDRIGGYIGNLAQLWPEARNKFNVEQSIDEYGDSLGIDPKIIRSDDEAAALTEKDQQAQQVAQQAEASARAADIAHKLGNASTADDTALGDTMKKAGMK